ncbi:MAG: M6 family metalloprotease domain-containing protein [bacterium]|nr:M6 family metalloprotease domain-containing protein [bacterium]
MLNTKYNGLSGALRCSLVIAVVFLIIGSTAWTMPPHPEAQARANAQAAATGLPSGLPDFARMHEMGICTPDSFFLARTYTAKGEAQLAPMAGPFRILALLVDFSDNVSSVAPAYFDTLIYGGSTGSVRHYFDEISYSQIDLVTVNDPSTIGWTRAPQAYAFYVDNNFGLYSSYPNNAQKMVEDVVDAVDGSVDFSLYDNDGNGYVDVLLVIHAGSGAELGGTDNTKMWSHKWAISPRLKDGVYISSYTAQPEFWSSPGDMTIGVYSHELCHGFGLPDLYDTDGSSQGIGDWGIMAGGSWNGSLGSSPAHPSAWSRIQMGFATPINVTANLGGQSIGAVNTGGSIYRLWTSGTGGDEYFLVENRQRVGYDAALPGDGLLIWHVDDAKSTSGNDNDQEWYPGQPTADHYLVALEQADGLYSMEYGSNQGGASDPFPGSGGVTTFNGVSSPNSDGYGTGGSFVAVEDISASSTTMTADLVVGIVASVDDDNRNLPAGYELSQNYPNPFNPTTTINFNLERSAEVKLAVFNVLGQHVKTLIDGPVESGSTSITWDAVDEDGHGSASGVYFYQLIVDEDSEETKKMLLVR